MRAGFASVARWNATAHAAPMMSMRRIAVELERTIYVVAGLPIALRVSLGEGGCDKACNVTRRAFAQRYWRPQHPLEWLELVIGIVLTPLVVPLAALWFTARNGPVIRAREGKGVVTQLAEQVRLYFAAGILAPWYYIFSLHRDGDRRAPTFLQRCETKWGVFLLLRSRNGSPLSDKVAFAKRCEASGVRCVSTTLYLDRNTAPDVSALPDCDLFVKPARGRGGKGAERWDRVGPLIWSHDGETLDQVRLIEHLRARAQSTPFIVQRRIAPHPDLAPLTSGALPTVRALTCLNERNNPEVVAAVFRMSFGSSRTVDNIHAGGLACRVALESGILGPASNLGSDARLGWHGKHPTTGAQIESTLLPFWEELKALAIKAHEAFADRVMVGWDIAIDPDGPIIVEGNGSPDVDLMQRFMELGFCHQHRFGELLAHHLRERGFVR
jgi:hypothetical protein